MLVLFVAIVALLCFRQEGRGAVETEEEEEEEEEEEKDEGLKEPEVVFGRKSQSDTGDDVMCEGLV